MLGEVPTSYLHLFDEDEVPPPRFKQASHADWILDSLAGKHDHPLPSGYCAGSRFLDLDITNLNFSNTVPEEHSDKNNFVHFAGKIVQRHIFNPWASWNRNDFDNFVKILKRAPYDDGQDPKKKALSCWTSPTVY